MHVAYNPTTNRQTGDVADANGNIGNAYTYDMSNRLIQASGTSMVYAYAPDNHRVWRGDGSTTNEYTFWSPSGQKLATYSFSTMYGLTLSTQNIYFGSRLIAKGSVASGGGGNDSSGYVTMTSVATDRLGSIGKFYPFGQERPSATANDTEKFTGYYRDAATGLDYAVNRYHNPGQGRFMTPDPAARSAKISDPRSWNRYAYVGGDPVNKTDAKGLFYGGCGLDDPSLCGDDDDDDDGGAGGGNYIDPYDFPNGPPCVGNAVLSNPCYTNVPSQPVQNPSNPTDPPTPVTCSYTAFSGSATPVAGDYGYGLDSFPGYGLPTNFTFSAQGGTGSYTWSETQSVTRYLKLPTGRIRLQRRGPDAPLYWSPDGSTTPPTGPIATVFDAPATEAFPAGTTVNWFFNLQVTVSSGGQTATCDVLWDAQISFDSSGGVSGSSWSNTQPSQ